MLICRSPEYPKRLSLKVHYLCCMHTGRPTLDVIFFSIKRIVILICIFFTSLASCGASASYWRLLPLKLLWIAAMRLGNHWEAPWKASYVTTWRGRRHAVRIFAHPGCTRGHVRWVFSECAAHRLYTGEYLRPLHSGLLSRVGCLGQYASIFTCALEKLTSAYAAT